MITSLKQKKVYKGRPKPELLRTYRISALGDSWQGWMWSPGDQQGMYTPNTLWHPIASATKVLELANYYSVASVK